MKNGMILLKNLMKWSGLLPWVQLKTHTWSFTISGIHEWYLMEWDDSYVRLSHLCWNKIRISEHSYHVMRLGRRTWIIFDPSIDDSDFSCSHISARSSHFQVPPLTFILLAAAHLFNVHQSKECPQKMSWWNHEKQS